MYQIDENEATCLKGSDDESSDTRSDNVPTTSVQVRRLLESIKLDPDLAALRARHDDDQNSQDEFRKKEARDEEAPDTKSDTLTCFVYVEGSKRKFSEDKTKAFDPSAVGDEHLDAEDYRTSAWFRYSKLAVVALIWLLCTIILITKKEKVSNLHQISVPPAQTKTYLILDRPVKRQVSVFVEGALLPQYYSDLSTRWMTVWVEEFEAQFALEPPTTYREKRVKHSVNVSDVWTIPVVSEDLLDVVPELSVKKVFELKEIDSEASLKPFIRIHFRTNLNSSFPIAVAYDLSPINIEDGVIYAAIVLLGLYVFIIFEVMHRTLAAMLAATTSVAILAALDERPTVTDIASWIDFETLLLLFSMMVMVGIFSETGIFDYLSVYTYRITNGRVWPLITTLCFFTGFLSSFLDNVTTALLMTPITIRLCEKMELNPVRILMAIVIFSNIGGALTPVGDPPNVIVASHPDVISAGVNFGVFTMHMSVGVLLVSVVVYCQLRFMFRNHKVFRYDEPQDVQELRHEIAIWQRAAASLTSYSKDEDHVRETLLKRVRRLLTELKMKLVQERAPSENYKANLDELTEKYPIRNWPLLYKSSFALLFVICVFFLHSIPELHLSLGCTAFLGATLLLILADRQNMEGVLARVEWSTLLFFASLFILMEALSRLRLIEWIGRKTEQLILGVDPKYQLSVAIILILWVSASASAFVDNIPLTTMMIRIVTSLAQNPQLDLPLMPLVWSLCFGACLGGVATLIGSSSNVVCAGVAEQHGYRFTFVEYFRVGCPVMIVSVSVSMVYLLLAHVALGWNT